MRKLAGLRPIVSLLVFASLAVPDGYRSGTLTSWRPGRSRETIYFVASDGYVYGVTHLLGVRSLSRVAAIGARDPLNGLPAGAPVIFRTQGRVMYVLDGKKETRYSIDQAAPRCC
jgi:hypothetical protein